MVRSVFALLAATAAGLPRLTVGLANTATELRRLVSGTVVSKQDNNYESWRRGIAWQPYRTDIHGRYPQLIAQVESETDVLAAVRFAREQGLKVAIKSGGHSESGAFLRNDSLLIDLGRLQSVTVDKESGIFQAQPGVWTRNLAEILRQNGLAFPVAHNATVSLGGYILAGGHGLNPDAWGTFACFNILAADVVTADGELVHCDADNHPDLFWAVRGAGPGFFGVVTRFYLKGYEYPSAMRSNTYGFTLDKLPEVLDWVQNIARSGISKTELLVHMISNPDANENSPDAERKLCLFNPVTFANSEQEAQDILAPVVAHPMAERCLFKQEQESVSFDWIFQRSFHQGYGRHSSDTMWTNSILKATALLLKRFPRIPSPKSAVAIVFRTEPILPEDAAASVIGNAFIGCYSSWGPDSDSADNIAWARGTIHSLRALSAGHYINEIDMFVNPELIPLCFSPAAWSRLLLLKKKYDPNGLFHSYPGMH